MQMCVNFLDTKIFFEYEWDVNCSADSRNSAD